VVSSHPPTRPSKPSQNVSSEDEKQEEVVLTESSQHIYGFACKTLFTAKKPEITQKIKDECELLAPHIKTFEQFKSLLQYVQSKFEAPYHLKNMTNELNDWLQIQNTASEDMQGLEWLPVSNADLEPEATQEAIETYLPDITENIPQTVEDVIEDFETTDQQLVDKMLYICHDYGQDASIDACLDALSKVRDEFRLHNTTLFDFMTEAYRVNLRARTCDVQSFFDELYASLSGAFDGQEQLAVVC
jgi:chaperonin cofactor prefoldin